MTERDNASHRFYANAKPEVTEAERAYKVWLVEQQAAGCWFDPARLESDFVHGYESTFKAGHASRDAEIAQREEAAAREMAEMILDDCPPFRDPKLIPATVDIYMRDWKQRKSQGGVGV